MGNPGVRLLVPSARVRDVRTMGEGESTPASASTAAPTGRSASPSAARARGRRRRPGRRRGAAGGQPLERRGRAAGRAARALPARGSREAAPATRPRPRSGGDASRPSWPPTSTSWPARGRRVRRRGAAARGPRRQLARRDRRRAALQRRRRPRPGRRRRPPRRAGARRPRAGRLRARWSASPSLPGGFAHVVLVDPPPFAHLERLASPARRGAAASCTRSGARPSCASRSLVLESQLAQRRELAAVVQGAARRRRGQRRGAAQGPAGAAARTRAPRRSPARCFRVLAELGLVQGAPDGGDGTVGVVSSEKTDLERSAAFRAYSARYEEGKRYLEGRRQP